MSETFDSQVDVPGGSALPETPHELPFDRGVIDALVDRVRAGERVNLLEAVLDALDWSSFATTEGEPLENAARDELRHYYRQKWVGVGPLYLAELLSTEFMTEQRARGDVLFSERLCSLARPSPTSGTKYANSSGARRWLPLCWRQHTNPRSGRTRRRRGRRGGSVGMKPICVVGGGGYVGLGYAVALAELGHQVVGLDIDATRVERLNRGDSPVYELGLPEMLRRNLDEGRLRFTTDYADGVPGSHVVFLCTGTPSLSDGEADLRQVRAAAASIGAHLQPATSTIIVNKSTMPVGTAELVAGIVAEHAPRDAAFAVISNPEFLREGRVLHDILHPDRVVLGGDDVDALAEITALYEPLGAPILRTDHRSAELIKYAANAFLATKISFINDIARLCERLGADVTVVAAGIGADDRIGPRFLHAGIGFGGSCFPKDVGALTRMAEGAGLHPGLLRAVLEINREAQRRFVTRADELLGGLDGREIAVWGLAFKEGTDDLRDSPAVQVVEMLAERGAAVRAHDPAALANAATRLPGIMLCDDLYEAVAGADAVALCTPWPEYASVDFNWLKRIMRGDLILDGRNMLDSDRVEAAGLRYVGIGRGNRHTPALDGAHDVPVPAP